MRYLLPFLITASMSACTPFGDAILVLGTPEGIRAYSDSQAALVAQARSVNESGDTAYWQQRRLAETEATARSPWSKFLGGN